VTSRSQLSGRWLPAAALGGVLVLLTLQPYSVCPFAVVSGLPCPGCGLTRSVVTLLQGRLADSWHFHPLGPVLVVLATAHAGRRLAARQWSSKVTACSWSSTPAYVWWGSLVVVMMVWVARFGGAFGGPAEVHSPFEAVQTLNRK
jgi:hypothetical protein